MSWSFQPLLPGASSPLVYTLTADHGSFALSGQAVTFRRALRLDAVEGLYSFTGENAGFVDALRVDSVFGSFAQSGQDVSLRRALRLSADHGAYDLAGQNAAIAIGVIFAASHRVFSCSGQVVTFSFSVDPSRIVGIENRFFTGRATYWPRDEDDGYGGWSYGSPIRYAVRWEEWVEERFDAKGDRFVSKAIVWLPEEVAAGGYLYDGLPLLANDPTTLDEAFVIRQVVVTPAVSGPEKEIRAYL
jgi:hypothetical protein